jgi:hypothetical protein
MAYYSKEDKARHAPQIKALLKKHGMRGSLSVRHHSTVVLTLRGGPIDFGQAEHGGHIDVNVYHIDSHFQDYPKARKFLNEAYKILMMGNHNNSDIQTDYFDVGWYVDIRVGNWDAPYVQVTEQTA